MRKWKIACGAAAMALSLTSAARADEWNKLTLLTFSGPVDVPGITLPAGTYRFQLADPEGGRQVIRVDDKDGKKTYGMFLSMSNQKLEPSDKPVVMFAESVAGAPPAVKVWFYPGETAGYEFVYPHDQALKIAKATHSKVLSMTDTSTPTTTDAERMASMKSAEVTRIDENEKVLTDATPTAKTTTTSESSAVAAPAPPSTTAQSTTASRAPEATTAERAEQVPVPVGTSGSGTPAPARRHLPGTGSELPLMELLSGLALAGSVALRAARKTLA
jgi:hypothetical protein